MAPMHFAMSHCFRRGSCRTCLGKSVRSLPAGKSKTSPWHAGDTSRSVAPRSRMGPYPLTQPGPA
eukprot:104384-Alexandrium_andersonii.AAC.1